MRPVLAISGMKDSGKTTLCLALASRLEEMGIKVGFVKRTHESVLSGQGTDTGLLLGKGTPAILWGTDGIRAEDAGGEHNLEWMLDRFMPEADLVLLEGGKGMPLPRVWVGSPSDCPDGTTGIFAWYDRKSRPVKTPSFTSGEEGELARFIAAKLAFSRPQGGIGLFVDGRNVQLKPYLANFLQGSIEAMVRPLKDTDGRNIYIHIRRGDPQSR
jgi:molybdopterin-guanine dinucleotide biosynthesis protein B